MAGYLSESDFVMVEEGFTTRDLLEELTLGGSQDEGVSFFVADLGDVVKKHLRFLKNLPRVRPFFVVKCNSSPGVLRALAELGLGFSCANKAEMELLRHIGVPVHKIIYTSPCKQAAQVKQAARLGIQVLSFDNEVELAKVARSHPTASFHVGSGCASDPQAFTQSIADARLVFEMGTELGYRMHILDLGGGFPGTEDSKVRFEEMASVINSALDMYFPEGCGVDILAEPGRYYVASAFTLAVRIVAKKEVPSDQAGLDEEDGASPKSIVYHISEGVYGAFNCVFFDNACPMPILQKKPSPDQRMFSSSLWGPTCDDLDRVAESLWLPELQPGDWLIFENMGAYTVGTSASCSGRQACQTTYAMSRVTCCQNIHPKTSGKQCEAGFCLRKRRQRTCVNPCRVAGRSQTLCVWAPSLLPPASSELSLQFSLYLFLALLPYLRTGR
ncbi:antizyme inhibitor 2 isoform X3 [Antechinus flavipes]|uniref:antizyme inhibitor 2 isoform X3 n=1 Tax=Antechinus flavipes TaxID=38775 RepID=UPI002235F726|nr:antizyme inhibitor 2 isoform X3 [Antechinus flavipes]